MLFSQISWCYREFGRLFFFSIHDSDAVPIGTEMPRAVPNFHFAMGSLLPGIRAGLKLPKPLGHTFPKLQVMNHTQCRSSGVCLFSIFFFSFCFFFDNSACFKVVFNPCERSLPVRYHNQPSISSNNQQSSHMSASNYISPWFQFMSSAVQATFARPTPFS